MKSRAVALVQDPASRIRTRLSGLLWLVALALALAALFTTAPRLSLAAATAPAGSTERYTVAGDQVIVYDLAGAIEVVAGSGPDVVVEVTRGGRDAAGLKIATGEIDGHPTLRVLFTGNRIDYPDAHGETNGIAVRADGTFGGKSANLFPRRVTVTNRGGGTMAWADLRILVPRGRTLDVKLGAGAMSAHGIDGKLGLDSHSGSVRVDGAHGALGVDTGSGDVEVRNVEGDLMVDTGSGGVTIEGVRGARVSIDTGSGGVTGRGVKADDLLVDTGSGHVELEDVRAPHIKVDTGSGGVTLGLLEDVENVLVDTGSGGVTLRVPSTLGAALDVDTGSGGIHSDVPLTSLRREGGELHAILGDGRGHILIDTGSGGVRLVKS